MTLSTAHASTSTRSTVTSANRPTRLLLSCGLIAGPFYIFVGLVQVLLRSGYNPARQDLSLLSNGNLGWIQITNFVISGGLTVAFAGGLARSLRNGTGRTWGPRLLALYGLGLIAAGAFIADPMDGFPPGTPSGKALHPTWHGTMHLVSGSIGFAGLIAACFVFSRRFSRAGQLGWARWSATVGILYFVAFVGIAGGSRQSGSTLVGVTVGFTVAVVLGWIWIFTMAVRSWTTRAVPSDVRGN
jgi:Protein of unknown function (DUF998)